MYCILWQYIVQNDLSEHLSLFLLDTVLCYFFFNDMMKLMTMMVRMMMMTTCGKNADPLKE